MFGAQLRRELMSIPHALYRLLEIHPYKVTKLWASAKRELICMAHAIPLMHACSSLRLPSLLFASDAMGAEVGGEDFGGFGVVVSMVSEADARTVLEMGELCGRGLATLGDSHFGLKKAFTGFVPTVPFSLLHSSILDPHRWVPVAQGRWRFADHIVLGEGRAVIKTLSSIIQDPDQHNHLVANLECGHFRIF